MQLNGAVPIVPTPFTVDEDIDLDALRRCVDFAAGAGLCAVCLPAYASEFYKLSDVERRQVVAVAVEAAHGRIGVVAQANHPSSRVAADVARGYEDAGADLISFALPRIFSLTEANLLDYAQVICRAVKLPVLIQDFNPGGPTVGGQFARQLAEVCANFRYLKLEQPFMGEEVRAIREATDNRIGVLEGWAGMYMLELIDDGICGVMPALGTSDLLQHVWNLAHDPGTRDKALKVFQVILPALVFWMNNQEFSNLQDKQLLVARSIIPEASAHLRRACLTPDENRLRHGQWLNQQLVELAERLNLGS